MPHPNVFHVRACTRMGTIFTNDLFPPSRRILFQSRIRQIPELMLTIPRIRIIVVISRCRRVLYSSFLMGDRRLLQLPAFNLRRQSSILRTRFQKVSMIFRVIPMRIYSFRMRKTYRPITKAFRTLQSPIYPSARFRIARPFQRLVLIRQLPTKLRSSLRRKFIHFKRFSGVILHYYDRTRRKGNGGYIFRSLLGE